MSTYSQLSRIIPPDQALANKALQNALSQVKSIFSTSLNALAAATSTLESNVGLSLINALPTPVPQDVINYFTSTAYATGTGPDNTLLLSDVIGTPTGWVINDALSAETSILNTMTSAGAFTSLTNGSTGVYTVMDNCIAGAYTQEVIVPSPTPPDPPTTEYVVVIPGGLPGAGTYGQYPTASEAIQDAFTNGLSPALVSAVATIVAAYPTQVASANIQWDAIAAQIETENQNLAEANVNFADLIPGDPPWGLVYSLPDNATDITEGGAAFVLESLAVQSTIGGQAVISTMREARNQITLNDAGMQTTINLPSKIPIPPANLGTSQYTAEQAANQKII
jgi:hypothetical protein